MRAPGSPHPQTAPRASGRHGASIPRTRSSWALRSRGGARQLALALAIERDHLGGRVAHEVLVGEFRLRLGEVRLRLGEQLAEALGLRGRIDEPGHGHEQRELADQRHGRLRRRLPGREQAQALKARQALEQRAVTLRVVLLRGAGIPQQQRNAPRPG